MVFNDWKAKSGENCRSAISSYSNLNHAFCQSYLAPTVLLFLYLDLAEFSPKDLYLFNLILGRVSAVVPDAINNNYGQFSCACNNSTCC